MTRPSANRPKGNWHSGSGTPARRRPPGVSNNRSRLVIGRFIMVAMLLASLIKLADIQVFEASALAEKASRQRATPKPVPAQRGAISDRNGNLLAFATEARALYVLPARYEALLRKANPKADVTANWRDAAATVKRVLGDKVDEKKIFDQLNSGVAFIYIGPRAGIEPSKAAEIMEKHPEIGAEYRAIRQYPGDTLASSVIGFANWRDASRKVEGLFGLENSLNTLLAGKDGRRVVDTEAGNDSLVIPGSERELEKAQPGSSVQLTIDSDIQYQVQKLLNAYVGRAHAKYGGAVVLDAQTGEILSMANSNQFDPNNMEDATESQFNDRVVTSPYEPGSVNKLITAAAAVENKVAKPDTSLAVPGMIKVADREIRDAWQHGTLNMSMTGVFAQSSNVGTLELAQQVGKEKWFDLAKKFGLGKTTGAGLPGESAGLLPEMSQWSGSTFANLPIGQGLSMTLLQMTGMYQAIANDGVRVPPRVIKTVTSADGLQDPQARPEGVRVVSPETAKTVRDMLRAVTQKSPGQTGTGPAAALEGYQVSGKTGTAQQIDPACACYSNSKYWITFAGILPADNPRYVVGLMLDAPSGGTPESVSAAPLFHEIGDYLTQRFELPMSREPSPVVPLILD
ncbi:penicillin-binding protein 2 [Pseudonocardiaceae bacterium YIM PH 21723]|nr:penicillin-binding protein 2 [Pseudonocardiaceae bacterium YIM PH 21723]